MRTIYKILFFTIALLFTVGTANAQKKKDVHGTATYTVSESDNITIPEAKKECINRARAEAIKEAFGETITSNTNMVDAQMNGSDVSNFVEETTLMSQAEWLGDTKEPEVEVNYVDGKLVITATVWGEAREIKQSKIDFSWKVLKGGPDGKTESDAFNNKDRIYITFRTPAAGFLAIYLLDSTNKEASCLLPYKTNFSGQQRVLPNRNYTFFDKATDPKAIGYNLTTKAPLEMDQVVLIFSPNPFTKCNEVTGDRRHPNSLAINDFEKWLRKMKKQDKDMVVDRTKWVKITNDNLNE